MLVCVLCPEGLIGASPGLEYLRQRWRDFDKLTPARRAMPSPVALLSAALTDGVRAKYFVLRTSTRMHARAKPAYHSLSALLTSRHGSPGKRKRARSRGSLVFPAVCSQCPVNRTSPLQAMPIGHGVVRRRSTSRSAHLS